MYHSLGQTFQRGYKGYDVMQIQVALDNKGYHEVGPLDGQYGLKTKQAVMHFQSDHGLTVDGIVGPETWAALMSGTSGAPANAPPTVTVPAVKPGKAGPVISEFPSRMPAVQSVASGFKLTPLMAAGVILLFSLPFMMSPPAHAHARR